MRASHVGIVAENDDKPHIQIIDRDTRVEPFAMVFLDQSNHAHVIADSPAQLRALARIFDEAAVRLSASLDVHVARAMNDQVDPAPFGTPRVIQRVPVTDSAVA